MARQFIFIFSLIVLLISACKSNLKNSDSKIYNLKFKTWIIDTIPILKKTAADYVIIIKEDSLSLLLQRLYSMKNLAPDSLNKETKDESVIYLLKKYNELPTEKFDLSYKTMELYHPTPIKNWRFEVLYSIEDIILKTSNETASYTYIRGRLSDKKVIGNDGRVIRIEFNWEKNELKKVKTN